jgi:hypothetical protein
MPRLHKLFDVRKYKLEIESFELEEIGGDEEIAAFERAGSSPTASLIQEQMIAESITAVNGGPVPVRPFVDWRKWNSRTRDFVREAFHRLNSGARKELDDFTKAAFGD